MVGPLSVGSEVAGYRIEGILGRGGMGVVYEATQLSLGRVVALKLLSPLLSHDPDYQERFRREGRLQAQIDHPHIVTVYEAGSSDAGLFIAMRLIRGETLKDALRNGPLDPQRVLSLLTPLADALDTAHEAGLIHRDVKPQNVLIGPRDHAYLADFGLTKGTGQTSLTAPGHFMGTPDYTAPELAEGGSATPASDVYAFAALLYECLTGGPPFPRPTQAAVLYAHVTEPPPRASERRPGLPPAIDDVLARGLAKAPTDRASSAGELMREAADALAQTAPTRVAPARETGPTEPIAPESAATELAETRPAPVPVPASPPATPPAPPQRRGAPRGRLAAAAAGLVGLVAIGIAVIGDGETPPAAVLGSPSLEAGPAVPGACYGESDRDRCTLSQTQLPEGDVSAPFDGVITRWRVRDGQGDITLRVLSSSGDVVRSAEEETVSGDGVRPFSTCLRIAKGERIGFSIAAGGGFGKLGTDGAKVQRWDGLDTTGSPESIDATELLFDADLERPGACEPETS